MDDVTSSDDGAMVVFLGDYDWDYPRERTLRAAIESQGATVLECRFRDSQLFLGPRKMLGLPLYAWRIWRRLRVLFDEHDVDAIYVSKFNVLVLPLVWLLTRRHGVPVIYDLFVSLYRTVEMRGVNRIVVGAVRAIDTVGVQFADRYVIGTDQLADLNAERYGLDRRDFIVLPVGADDERFEPRDDVEPAEPFTAVYWGNFLPHHGVEVILDAAEHLRDDDSIRFVFMGEGPRLAPARDRAEAGGLNNVEFRGRVPWDELTGTIAAGQVALGIFSEAPRARASITNKVFEGVAMARPVVTGDTETIRDWFEHGESVYTVPPTDGEALANALRDLQDDPALRESIAIGGREVYDERFSLETIGRTLLDRIETRPDE